MPKVFNLITVKYLPATNSRGSRIRLSSNKRKTTKTLKFDSLYCLAIDQAVDYLKQRGFSIVGISENIIITDTFDELKES
jgi:hypothetical protein